MVFAFQGSVGHAPGIGSGLYRAHPVFRQTIDDCAAVTGDLAGFSLVDLMFSDEPIDPDPRTVWRYTVILAAVQLGLQDLWKDNGIEPDAVFGISLGEMTAAYAAGALSRTDAIAAFTATVTAAHHETHPIEIFPVAADADQAKRLCGEAPGDLAFIGEMTPTYSTMISTPRDSAEVRRWLADRVAIGRVNPSPLSYHTTWFRHDPELMMRPLAGLRPRPPVVPIYSAAAGARLPADAELDGAHWYWTLQHPFYHARAVSAFLRDGYDLAVLIGGHPHTKHWLTGTAEHLGRPLRIVDSMRNDATEPEVWQRAVEVMRATPRAVVRPAAAPPSAATLDLLESSFVAAPHVALGALREQAPVQWLEREGAWAVLGDEQVRWAFGHPEVLSNRSYGDVDHVLLGADGDAHRRVRRAIAPLFDAERRAGLATFAAALAESLLAPVDAGEEVDVVGEVARPLAERSAGHLLGFDDATTDAIRTAIDAGAGSVPERTRAAIAPHVQRMEVTRVVDGLAPDEALSLASLLWFAAVTTTRRALASAVLLLLSEPGVRAAVTADGALTSRLVDETLRLHPPEHIVPRVATADVRLGGAEIRAGDAVRLCLGAANRDPRRYDAPDRVVLDRPARQLGFGLGAHRCPGSRMATIEASALLDAFCRRPDVELIQPRSLRSWTPLPNARGLQELVVGPPDPGPLGIRRALGASGA